MDMQVTSPSPPAVDFNFDSACTTPYISAPSSPQQLGNFFFSAPTSPNRAASFYRELNEFSLISSGSSLSVIPFNWEEKPGIPKVKSPSVDVGDDADFEFDFSGQLEKASLPADELFDGGKIKPLKPPPRLQCSEYGYNDSPKSPRSPISSRILSPRQRRKDVDPFAAAMEETRKQSYDHERGSDQQRGREKTYDSSASSSRHKGTRSWSPFRVSDVLIERDIKEQSTDSSSNATTKQTNSQSSSSSSSSSSTSSWRGYRKWKLKDLLLFRSASEGRATDKDALKKYAVLKKTTSEDVKNSSFRSTDSSGSVSSSRRRGPVSAHELHYTANRAVAEEMKKKTFLPYNKGILLGCLGFIPTAGHDLSKGPGSLNRG